MSGTGDDAALRVERADRESDAIVANLLQLYVHDMSEWFRIDTDRDGRFAYDLAAHRERRAPVYLAHAGEVLAGFAITGSARPWLGESDARDLHEFFVLRRHRGTGIAERFAAWLWDAEPGEWLVRCFRGNRPALPFWRRSIAVYTGGRATEEQRALGEREWSYFRFASRAQPR